MKTSLTGPLLLVLALLAVSACGRDESAGSPPQPAAGAAEQELGYVYSEGTHFDRLPPPHVTVAGQDEIEVIEFFWYGCPHCNHLEEPLNGWVADAPDNVRFLRIPITWSQAANNHARVHYTLRVLASTGAIADFEEAHAAVYDAIHQRRNSLIVENQAEAFFAGLGVDAETFASGWNSAEVAASLQSAAELARRYRIDAVPTIVINGAYVTSEYQAGPDLFKVMDEIIAREEAAL